jgi:hypothetical protein
MLGKGIIGRQASTYALGETNAKGGKIIETALIQVEFEDMQSLFLKMALTSLYTIKIILLPTYLNKVTRLMKSDLLGKSNQTITATGVEMRLSGAETRETAYIPNCRRETVSTGKWSVISAMHTRFRTLQTMRPITQFHKINYTLFAALQDVPQVRCLNSLNAGIIITCPP